MLGRRLALLVFFLCAALLMQPCVATPFQWEYTGSLNEARRGHTATLLFDGRVLVAGSGTATAELYDPATGIWTYTGSLNNPRAAHTATLLFDGRVLVAGGGFNGQRTAELYDPATGIWTYTGSLNASHELHTATLLPNGKVLVAGGGDSAEIYDPTIGTWTLTGSLNIARAYHTATLLPDGRVLVAGGGAAALTSAELYDPAIGTWTLTGSLHTGRECHTATLLPDGRVLVAGGWQGDFGTFLASAELYDPATGGWTVTGRLNDPRAFHPATLLSDGRVLVAGGFNAIDFHVALVLASAELYDPATGIWTLTGSLNTERSDHTATLLSNGEVLAAGGANSSSTLASAELYDPGITAATRVDGSGSIENNRGREVTFRFSAAQADDSSRLGQFTFCDTAAGKCTAKVRVQSLSITGNTASFSGQARLDGGTRVTFTVNVTDNGSPGTSDTIAISLSNGYSVSGTLISGDIRIQ